MGNAGYILRFVDVVLILLFGFISISSIEQSDIEPPESTETQRMAPEEEELIFVSITPDGTFLMEEESKSVASTEDLRAYLKDKVSTYGDTPVKVKLRSSWKAPMQYLAQAARVCDEIGVRKSVEVKLRAGE